MEVGIEKALTQQQIVTIKKAEQNTNKLSADDNDDEKRVVELGLTAKAVYMQVRVIWDKRKFLEHFLYSVYNINMLNGWQVNKKMSKGDVKMDRFGMFNIYFVICHRYIYDIYVCWLIESFAKQFLAFLCCSIT